jgi:hypothetical protein
MINIISEKFINKGVESPLLIGNIQDDIIFECNFDTEFVIFSSDDNIITTGPTPLSIGTTNTTNLISSQSAGTFDIFKLNEIIRITFTNPPPGMWVTGADWRIVDIFSDTAIRVELIGNPSFALPFGEFYGGTTNIMIASANEFKSIEYKYEFDYKNNNYKNKITGETNQYNGLANIVGTYYDMISSLSNPAKIGNCEIKINNTGVIKNFTLKHTFKLFDFISDTLLSDISNGLPSSDFSNDYEFKYSISVKDSNGILKESIDTSISTNTAGYDRNLENGIPKYNIKSIEYSVGSSINNSIDLQKVNDIKIRVGTSFAISNILDYTYQLSFVALKSNYNEIDKTYLQNLCYSNVTRLSIEQDSLGYKVFNNNLSITIINPNEIEISTQIELGSKVIESLKSNNSDYVLFLSIDTPVSTFISSRNVVDYNKAFESLPNIDIFNATTLYGLNPFSERAEFYYKYTDNIELFPTDDVMATTLISYDNTIGIDIQAIESSIIAVKAGNTLVLDSVYNSVSSFANDSFGVKDIEINKVMPFKVSQKNTYEIKRRSDLDEPTKKYYEINYPFVVRWETWIKANINSIPSDLYMPSSPVKGIPYYYYYYQLNGYTLFHRTKAIFSWNGSVYEDNIDKEILINDYISGGFTLESIKSFDANNLELLDAGTKYIKGLTRIEAKFTTLNTYILSDLSAYFMIEDFESSGLADARKTMIDRDNTFKTIKNISMSIGGGVITIIGYVNSKDLTDGKKTVYCRLFEKINTNDLTYIVSNLNENIDTNNNESLLQNI